MTHPRTMALAAIIHYDCSEHGWERSSAEIAADLVALPRAAQLGRHRLPCCPRGPPQALDQPPVRIGHSGDAGNAQGADD